MAPALIWKARVVGLISSLPKGAAIGYNARYHASRDMRGGYRSGLCGWYSPRFDQQGAEVEISRHLLAPIVGAVSIDLTTIDVTDCGDIQVNDEAIIIGEKITTADDMARTAGTISYEILTSIGNRVERTFTAAPDRRLHTAG